MRRAHPARRHRHGHPKHRVPIDAITRDLRYLICAFDAARRESKAVVLAVRAVAECKRELAAAALRRGRGEPRCRPLVEQLHARALVAHIHMRAHIPGADGDGHLEAGRPPLKDRVREPERLTGWRDGRLAGAHRLRVSTCALYLVGIRLAHKKAAEPRVLCHPAAGATGDKAEAVGIVGSVAETEAE